MSRNYNQNYTYNGSINPNRTIRFGQNDERLLLNRENRFYVTDRNGYTLELSESMIPKNSNVANNYTNMNANDNSRQVRNDVSPFERNRSRLSAFNEFKKMRTQDKDSRSLSQKNISTIKRDTTTIDWSNFVPINQYELNRDENPEIIYKKSNANIVYEQEIGVRYLKPPTPPPPGEIVVRQEPNIVTPPAPALIIRQQPPKPKTPSPLVIREAPPPEPPLILPQLISVPGKVLPAPPQKVVIERLPSMPSKPRSILIERWLPYIQKRRKVVLQKPNEPDPVIVKPKNVIIQWEPPVVKVKRELKDLGVVKTDPVEYVKEHGRSLKSLNELPEFVKDIKPSNGLRLASEQPISSSVHELEGDIDALNLIDLEKNGLSEYKNYLNNKHDKRSASLNTFIRSEKITDSPFSSNNYSKNFNVEMNIAEALASIDTNSNNKIPLYKAENLFVNINIRLRRVINENDIKTFLGNLHLDTEKLVDFMQFRHAIIRHFLL